MFRRPASFLRLPASERRLAARALATLAVVRLSLSLMPFRGVRAGVDRWSGGAVEQSPDVATAKAVKRAIERAARTLPGSACLAQALAAEVLLRRAGQAVEVSIGVAPGTASADRASASDATSVLDAHAWARCAGVVVAGERADLAAYRTLAVFGDARPAGS